MIEFCNRPCLNCGEYEDECECSTFVFDKNGAVSSKCCLIPISVLMR